MDIFQILALGIAACALAVIVKNQRPELAMQISVAAGLFILVISLSKITGVMDTLRKFSDSARLNTAFLSVLFKVIGIAYITEFTSEVCRDAGEAAIAVKLELAGKVAIVVLSVPILLNVFDTLTKILS